VDTAVTSLDFLKRDDRFRTLLRSNWDLVMMDEAHLATDGSQRGRVLRALWTADTVDLMVALSATPGGLLDDLLASAGEPTVVLRRGADDIVDWEGRPILRAIAKEVEIFQVQLSTEERHLFEMIRTLLREGLLSSRSRQVLAPAVYLRSVASSLYCFENLVRRALVRSDLHDTDEAVPSEVEDVLDSTDAALRLPLEREDLLHLTTLIDHVEVDTKWAACAQVLQSRLPEAGGSGIIFCDFVDTARYVAGLALEAGIRVELVSGAIRQEERFRALTSFRESGGVLVLTSGVTDGLNLSFVKLCVHYDLPWRPTALARRFACVDRFGAPPGPVRHVVFADEVFTHVARVERLFSPPPAAMTADSEILADILQTPSTEQLPEVR